MGVPNQRHPNDPQPESSPSGLSPELVLAYLATLSQPASIREIAHGMELKHHGRRFLPRVLHRLKKSGDIEEKRGRYKLPGAKETQKAATKRKDRESAAEKIPAQARSENKQPAPRRLRHRTAATTPILFPAELLPIATATPSSSPILRSLAWKAISSSDATT